jgi:phage terminase large subunit-like protein
MMLELQEDKDFYFDEKAAERPVRFIEKYCWHYEGIELAGTPFLLEEIQKRIIRNLYGWKWKHDRRRRFTDCYWEGAVGAGKSPVLAGLGLYGLMADGEKGAQIYSLAMNYGQARVVFECAKKFAEKGHPELTKRLQCVDREIRHKASNSVWRIVSGKGPGAGCRPTLTLGDEAHEWPGPGAYNALRDRMFKRHQPLCIIATNAGKSKTSFCWQLREKAVAALEGKGDPTLYPIIWKADDDAATDDPQAWRDANPLMGITIKEEKVRLLAIEKMKNEEEEADFRRLYLGIWPTTTAGRWLNLAQWDACVKPLPTPAKDSPVWFAFDLSQCDDLCAVVDVWPTDDAFAVDAHFWMPNVTAQMYALEDGIPYDEWAKAGHITLVDKPTITDQVRRDIAAWMVARSQGRKVQAICYDRYKADITVAELEAKHLPCVPVPQGYSLSPGCQELDRRLKEGGMLLTSNPVLRYCAECCEVKEDDRGNLWPVKPKAKGQYKGERRKKIDGVVALVTAMVEARKFVFAKKEFPKDAVCLIKRSQRYVS